MHKRQIHNASFHKRDIKSDHDSFVIASDTKGKISSRCKYVSLFILTVYLFFLIYRAFSYNNGSDVSNVPVWDLQDSQQLLGWIRSLVFIKLFKFAYFVPVGFIITMIVPDKLRWPRWFPINLPALVVASVLVSLVYAVEIGLSWHLDAKVNLTFSMLGCLFGTWIGTTWLLGWYARFWFLPKMALLISLAVILFAIILQLSIEDTSLPFEAASVTSAEKRRLVELVRDKSPRSLEEGQTHTLRLTEHDINTLLSWGLSLGSPNRKAKIDIASDSALLSTSIGLTLGGEKTRYLNLVMAGSSEIVDGVLSLNVDRCRLGSMEIPRWLLRRLSPFIVSLLSHDRRLEPFLDAVREMKIEPNSIVVTYGHINLPSRRFREDLFGPESSGEEVLESTRAQVENLLAAVSQLPDKQPSFGMCMEAVFTLARERSAARDPVIENRAAIFALGMLLGHPRIEEFLGPVHEDQKNYTAKRILSRVVLRGRPDWTKHFCVAAAIALLSDEVVSDAASLLKEELDADSGGSGFSFSDLLMSRAGTTFAIRATRDEASARAVQDRISSGFSVEDFCPNATDLPEGISDAELQSLYGGVGGEGYNHLIEEIEQRISMCAAYR